jgi:hypothetical protein
MAEGKEEGGGTRPTASKSTKSCTETHNMEATQNVSNHALFPCACVRVCWKGSVRPLCCRPAHRRGRGIHRRTMRGGPVPPATGDATGERISASSCIPLSFLSFPRVCSCALTCCSANELRGSARLTAAAPAEPAGDPTNGLPQRKKNSHRRAKPKSSDRAVGSSTGHPAPGRVRRVARSAQWAIWLRHANQTSQQAAARARPSSKPDQTGMTCSKTQNQRGRRRD